MKTKILFFCALLTFFPFFCAAEKELPESPASLEEKTKEEFDKISAMLLSVSELKSKLEQQIIHKQKSSKKASVKSDKQALDEQIDKLKEDLNQTSVDFEKIATGVDISKFITQEKSSFDWKEELFSLMQPGIMELKRLTVQPRRKSALLNQQESYKELLPIAQKAAENLKRLQQNIDTPTLQKEIKHLIPQWENTINQLQNGLEITEMELTSMEEKRRASMGNSKQAIKNFFRTSGFYIAIALVSCALVVVVLRLLYLIVRKAMPGRKKEYRPVHLRIIDLGFQIASVIAALFSFILVFYFFEDWLLLSFTILFLAGLGWTAKTFLPKFWKQSCMMLNFGNVREGERVILYGVPWLVKDINFRTKLENPTLGMTIKVPIEKLLDKVSRSFNKKEPWFPCRENDWVILADGTRGRAISISYEQVELLLRGGACKTYQTQDFLGLAPLNLSRNFRIKEVVGIGYTHQAEATGSILQKLETFLLQQIEKEGYNDALLNLRVEFQSAGSSSLDIVVIADFKGSQAAIYNRLRRTIQRWCVDACTENDWDIPFPQLTVHKGEL